MLRSLILGVKSTPKEHSGWYRDTSWQVRMLIIAQDSRISWTSGSNRLLLARTSYSANQNLDLRRDSACISARISARIVDSP
jgi:hypothetical protein